METPQAQPGSAPTPHPPGALVPPKDESSEVHGQYEPGSLNAQCLIFMRCVNQSFGEHSREWNTIHQALNEFKEGRLSKREAYGTMKAMLGENEDLRRGLLRVLSHRDADWGPGDFDEQDAVHATTASESRTSPLYLQPQHQPQMRLPPMSAAWYSNQYVVPHATNPALLGSPLTQYISDRSALMQQQGTDMVDNTHTRHDDYNGYGNLESYGDQGQNHQMYAQNTHINWNPFTPSGNWSPAPPLPSEVPLAHCYVSPSIDPTASYNTYPGVGYGEGLSSPGYGVVEHGHPTSYPSHESCQEGNAHRGWTNAELHRSQQGLHAFSGYQQLQSPITAYQEPTPELAPSHQNSPYEPPSEWGTPTTVPSVQPVRDEMLPPPKKRSRNNSVAYSASLHPGSAGVSEPHRQSLPPVSARSSSNHQPNDAQAITKARKTRAAMGPGQFIHAICGKNFHTRSAVKKHHWGSRVDDISTTTGCWAKNNKPNREWDEHSSCKQDMPPSRFVKSTPTQAKAEELQQFQAPMVPAMIPKPMNIIPGFPILQELPNAVAEAVNAMPVFDREPIPYHTARMPTRGSFDSLLTAVNAVSKVDAPIPQGRNGLVVSHLDAQATAAEHNARSFLPPAFRNQGRQHVFHAREQLPAIGLGISQAGGPPVSLDTVPSSQDEKASSETQQAPTSLEMETMPAAVGVAPLKMDQSSSPYQDQSKDESKKDRRTSSRRSAISKQEQKALGLSVSPGPDRKKLKV